MVTEQANKQEKGPIFVLSSSLISLPFNSVAAVKVQKMSKKKRRGEIKLKLVYG